MSSHQASEQMIGYLYQVRVALALLLDNENSNYQISIEKFDDIAFSQDDTPKQLIQLKHHVKRHGDLTDASTDLWRTLKAWIDAISESPDLIDETDFLILTTAIAPDDTAAWYLRSDNNRNVQLAYEKLKTVCEQSQNKDHKQFYQSFLNTNENTIRKLISKIYIWDKAHDIVGVEKVFRKHIRYSCDPKHEDLICERLEGWWYRRTIGALCSVEPVFTSQNEVRSYIVSVSQEYMDDNLPIEFLDLANLTESDFSENDRVFCEQLKLICVSNRHIQTALRDYYRAFRHRASWIRDELVFIHELEKYEQRLIDEWEHSFASMEDTLANCDAATEEEKVLEGRRLFSTIENKDVIIRPKCQEAFVMRGSYHMLANQLKVGWHVDFYSRLTEMLGMQERGQ